MASSSSGGHMMMPSSSSSSGGGDQKYDVFLSFRGEDTRRTFVCYLYEALQRSMIKAYIDSEDLDKGKRISELLIAIEDSRISIVVLSQDYASSKWCLRELAKIMECMDKKQQVVVPIFYDVDPSDVRKIKGTFAQAFAKHKADSDLVKEELKSWRSALSRFGEISGWNPREYKDDAKLIKEVVEKTDKKVNRTSSHKASGGLVGMDFHITQMYSRLCLKVNEVRVVGIWGMGGLGKTTIAQAVYDEIACQFEHSCFVHNVKEALKNKREVGVQQDIISKLSIKEMPTGGLNSWNTIKESLGRKRVLVVLDDVENFSQIEEVLGEPHAFGKGSRIIVTTRDKQSPKEVDETYHPDCLNQDKSRELLVKHAFRKDQSIKEYYDVIKQAIEYAQGLPLALQVLGASLCDKKIHQWKDLLEKIKIIPHRKIMDVLRISFLGLDVLEQQIFLDIACLFRGWDHHEVTEILYKFHSDIGLENIVNRALVTISKWDELDMHDLLQEMGREIVRRESHGGPLKELGQHSRLWSFEDVDQVLTQNTATDAIECLILKFPYDYEDETYCINVGVFARMTKLRVLIIDPYEQVARGELEFLSHELRLLKWPGCPLESLPNTYIPKNLVRLDMSDSDIQQFWEGTMRCRQLKILPSSLHMKSLVTLNLSGCSKLGKFPEISNVMSELQKLDLAQTAIKELPESINNLTGLRVLRLSDCKELTTLPSSIYLSLLRELDLSGCSNLENFPEISGIMKELPELYLDGTAVRGLPSSIDTLKGIKKLSMRNCKSLECLPDSICNLAQLTHLDLKGCNRLKSIPELSSSIYYIDAHDCTALETVSIPKTNSNGTSVDLRFSNCSRLQANLFREIVETHSLNQDDFRPSCVYMCLPGSEIPEWFNLRDTGCSLSLHVPMNSFSDKILGLSICIAINFRDACHDVSNMYGRCHWTSKGNRGEYFFKFDVLSQRFRTPTLLESDHLFMAYLTWFGYGWTEEDKLDAFEIVVETGTYFPTEDCFTSSYGVCLVYANHEEMQNSVTRPILHVDGQSMEDVVQQKEGCCAEGGVTVLGTPSFPDQLEIRKSATEWEAESTETAAQRGTYQILELLPEPQTEKNEEEVMVAAAQVDGPRVLGSVSYCLSLSGCSCIMSSSDKNRTRSERDKVSELGSHRVRSKDETDFDRAGVVGWKRVVR